MPDTQQMLHQSSKRRLDGSRTPALSKEARQVTGNHAASLMADDASQCLKDVKISE